MQSNKGQRCDLCGKGEAKTRDKDASLQINNVQANYTMQDNCNCIRGDNNVLR